MANVLTLQKLKRACSFAWVLFLFLTLTVSMWVFQTVGRLTARLKGGSKKR
jgi:hypothetical protein